MYRTYLRLKACPKCGGDILVDRGIEDDDVCMQCGFRGFVRVADNKDSQDRVEKISHHEPKQVGESEDDAEIHQVG